MKKIIYAGLSILILLSSVAISHAKFSASPSVEVREEYNDNIFLVKTLTEDDFITTIYPRVKLKYSPSKILDLSLDYGLRFNFFARHSHLDDTSLSETQNIDFKSQFRPLNHIFIDTSDVYEKVQVDVRDPVAEDNVFFNKTVRNTFIVSPFMKFPLTSTMDITPGYSYSNIWHKSEEFNDYEVHSAYVDLSESFTKQFSGAVKYTYSVYNNLSDEAIAGVADEYHRHIGSVRARYQVTDEFNIYGEFGRAWTDFEGQEELVETDFWNAGTDYTFASSTVGAGYSLTLYDSPSSGAFKRKRVDITFKTGRQFSLYINPFYSIDTYLNSDREDRIVGTDVEMSKSISEILRISLDGGYEKQEFFPESEIVHRSSISVGLEYMITRNITAGTGYTYNNRDSDSGASDFSNNILWLNAEVTF